MEVPLSVRLDELRAQWTRIGGRFTVAAAREHVSPEALLAETARYGEHDERLFFVAATWLGTHLDLLNRHRLGECLGALKGKASAVAGALCSVARRVQGASSDRLEAASSHCDPLESPEPLFQVMDRYPSLIAEAQDGVLPEFERWGLVYHEISLKSGAVRPASWIRSECPELRMRQLLGGTLEADILHLTLEGSRTASELQSLLGSSYSATHQAAMSLAHRGILERTQEGRSRPFSVPRDVRDWLRYPSGRGY